jgi:hypothetical protein
MFGKVYGIYYDSVIGYKILDLRPKEYTTGEIKHFYSLIGDYFSYSYVDRECQNEVIGVIHIPQDYSIDSQRKPIVTGTQKTLKN